MKAIEICIGLVFIYLLLSLMATILLELFAGLTAQRGKLLGKAIADILRDNQGLSTAFFQNPLYKQLQSTEKNTPSYISAGRFWNIIYLQLFKDDGSRIDFQTLEKNIREKLPDGDFKNTLLLYINQAEGSMAKLQLLLNQWYDECMEGLTGWYKRKTQGILILIGLILAVFFNANSIRIYETLNADDKKREALVAMAEKAVSDGQIAKMVEAIKNSGDTSSARADSLMRVYRSYLDTVRQQYAASSNLLGLGWNCDCPPGVSWKAPDNNKVFTREVKNALYGCPETLNQSEELRQWLSLLGWLITGLAISLGAPFWFDILKLLINIRNAGKAPDEKRNDITITADKGRVVIGEQ